MKRPAEWFAVLLLWLAQIAQAQVPNTEGDRLCLLNDPIRALQARFDLIEHAESTIDLAYFAVETDEVPVALLERLRQASHRGVRVRLLVDGLKSRLPSKFEQYLMRQGIELAVYHEPQRRSLRHLNQRLHSKLMVVDRSVAIVGSRNLENEFFHFDPQDRNFVDCEAIVTGQVVDRIHCYFDWLWRTPDVSPGGARDSLGMDVLNYRPYGQSDWKRQWRRADSDADFQRLLDQSLQKVTCRYGLEFPSNTDWSEGCLNELEIHVLHDSTTDKRCRHVQSTIIGMIDQAQHCIQIESPYPAFHPLMRQAIRRARSRGVQVTILTNSLQSTDQENVYAAYQNQKRSLLAEGVRLHEYCGDQILHAKTMIIDHSTMMLGSYNFDVRSDTSNLELCLVVHDPAAAAALQQSFSRRLAQSIEIDSSLILKVGSDATLGERPTLVLRRLYVELIRGLL